MSTYLKNLRALLAEEESRVWSLLLQVKTGPVRESLNWARSHLRAALLTVDEQIEQAEASENGPGNVREIPSKSSGADGR